MRKYSKLALGCVLISCLLVASGSAAWRETGASSTSDDGRCLDLNLFGYDLDSENWTTFNFLPDTRVSGTWRYNHRDSIVVGNASLKTLFGAEAKRSEPESSFEAGFHDIATISLSFLNGLITDNYSSDIKIIQYEKDNLIDAQVPEPATILLLGLGIAGLSGVINMRKKQGEDSFTL